MTFDYAPPKDLLAGRTVLITGAGDGIGKAVAMACADHGAQVILLGRSLDKLETVYDQIESRHAGRAILHPLDLQHAGEADAAALAEAIDSHVGHLDGLLHNAAHLGARTPMAFYPWQDWQTAMQVNVNAAFLLTRALLPLLERAPDGRILFTASSVGRAGRAYWGAYAASKFAVEGMMQVLAEELANTSRVRVNSLNPGGTQTAMRKAAYPAENPAHLPAPEALVPVYLYLLGPDSRALHGRALNAREFEPGSLA